MICWTSELTVAARTGADALGDPDQRCGTLQSALLSADFTSEMFSARPHSSTSDSRMPIRLHYLRSIEELSTSPPLAQPRSSAKTRPD
ncbi:hypothetical protein M514_02123 [Trichuris suis]|uniref:Uncharacterized protein n=1 Tax=Trichuris suis TaxID=68888 RepID=A0A085MWW6_9BILA|nr:hypothetical protein M513_02123 [Trichuris suis]KFD61712.1 hypothetical protein M514_02123 [Trichuris suis]